MNQLKNKLQKIKTKDYFTLKQLINASKSKYFAFGLFEEKITKVYTNKTKFVNQRPTFNDYFLIPNCIVNPFICNVLKVIPHHLVVKEYSTELTFALPIYEIASYYMFDESELDGFIE